MFVCDFDVKDQFLSVILQRFSRVIEFNVMDTLAADEFLDLCDKFSGPVESHFFAYNISEIRLLSTCKGCRKEN